MQRKSDPCKCDEAPTHDTSKSAEDRQADRPSRPPSFAPKPVVSPQNTGWVVKLKTLFGVRRWYGERTDAVQDLGQAHVFGDHVTALEACRVVGGVGVWSLGLAA